MVLAQWSSTWQRQRQTLNLDRVHLSYWRSLYRLVEAGDEKVRLLSKNLRMSSRLETTHQEECYLSEKMLVKVLLLEDFAPEC